jgi:CBS domain-containing protein
MNVGDIMTQNPETTQMTNPIVDVAAIMRDINVGFIPVMNGDILAGVVTDRDIVIRGVAENMDLSSTSIGEIVSSDIQAVSTDTNIDEAASIMEDHKIRRLPVVDEDGMLVGVCSLGDIAVRGKNLEQSGEILELVSEPSRPELAA